MVEEIAMLLIRVALVSILFFGICIPVARLIAGNRTLAGHRTGVMRTRSARGGGCS